MANQDRTTISVIVPTCNRPIALDCCLAALAEQDFPCSDFEVIVVNDGGFTLPPETGAFLRQRASLVQLKQMNRGPAAARNLGARVAQGQFLAFTDDDCVPSHNWLTTLFRILELKSNLIVGGRTLNGLADNLYALTNETLNHFLYHYYHLTPGEKSQPPFFSSNNLAMSLQAFQSIGGFDERLRTAEDRDLCERLREAGYLLHFAEEMLVHHFQELTLKSFLVLHFRYGRGNYFFHLFRNKRGWGNYRLEPFRFYSGMLRYPYSRTVGGQAAKLSFLLALSQVCNMSGFFTQAMIQAYQQQ